MGIEREEEFMFSLNKTEIIKYLVTNGNYTIDAILKRMIETENAKDLVNEFETLIMMSYGERSLDGRQFIKSQEVKDAFRYSAAYDALFMELISDAKKAAEFFNVIIPADLADEVNKIMNERPEEIPEDIRDLVVNPKPDNNVAKITQMPNN